MSDLGIEQVIQTLVAFEPFRAGEAVCAAWMYEGTPISVEDGLRLIAMLEDADIQVGAFHQGERIAGIALDTVDVGQPLRVLIRGHISSGGAIRLPDMDGKSIMVNSRKKFLE